MTAVLSSGIFGFFRRSASGCHPARFLAGILVCFLGVLVNSSNANGIPVQKTNVIFILADDVGAFDLGCYGSKFHLTPNIDALAAKGLRLTQAYANNPSCSPTRASIMTGLDPARIGITNPSCHLPTVFLTKGFNRLSKDTALSAQSLTRLNTTYVTIAESLKAAGYRTAHFGKWHLGREPYSPLEQGFESDWPHTSAAGPGGATGYFSPWAFALDVAQTLGEHIEDRTAQEAVAWMTTHKDEPFFLNYWAFSAHGPWYGKKPYVDWFTLRANPKNPQRNPVYAAMLWSLDEAVGKLVQGLNDAGIADRTIIVFTSDNGGCSYLDPELMVRFGMSSPPTSNVPLRSGKGGVYEGGTRVPAIIVWPKMIKPGTVSPRMLQSVDYYPTLLDMVGLPVPRQKIDGISQVPALIDGKVVRDTVFCHWPNITREVDGSSASTSVRKGNFKLIRFYVNNADFSDRYELYNLADDIGEKVNLAAQAPQKVLELNRLIDGYLADTRAVVPHLNPNRRSLKEWAAVTGSVLTTQGGLAKVISSAGRPTIHLARTPSANGHLTLSIRMKVTGDSRLGIFYWGNEANPGNSGTRRLEFNTVNDGLWHTYSLDFVSVSNLANMTLIGSDLAEEVRFDWIQLSRTSGPLLNIWRF